jgi:hypothetical protein
MRLTDFRQRMAEAFGPVYAASIAIDQVIPGLNGRTVERALAEGTDTQIVWRAVVAEFGDRIPAKLH